MIRRLFYAAAGPADFIAAHESWKRGVPHPTEVSLSFSGQVEDACRDLGIEAMMVSVHPREAVLRDGLFTLEHRPKPCAIGWRHHVGEWRYARGLVKSAREFHADAVLVDSGVTHYFMMELFRHAGAELIVVLHNTLWPEGHPPRRAIDRVVWPLNARFFREVPLAVLGVSPSCLRQVRELTGGATRAALLDIRAQFRREYFAGISPTPPWTQRPFRILFVGRITREKGVFDILEIARRVEAVCPGEVRWELCGGGPDLEALVRARDDLGLGEVVILHGWTSPGEQLEIYGRNHACIVPTRSEFAEGLPMTAAEAVLAGRPVITCAVVPALELLRPACLEARTDDVQSYVEQVLRLVRDEAVYRAAQLACAGLEATFYDREQGLGTVLRRVLAAGGNPG